MPLYDYQCRICGERFTAPCSISERNRDKECPVCCTLQSERITDSEAFSRTGVSVWKPKWFEHITSEPVFVESKHQLRELEKKHNVTVVQR